jgi:hypothetical protein
MYPKNQIRLRIQIGDLMNVAISLAAQFETLTLQELIVNYPELLTPYLSYLKVSDPSRYRLALMYLGASIPESSKTRNSRFPDAAQ